MSYYDRVYKKRLGRDGDNPSERISKGRERNFESFLKASPHTVDFPYGDKPDNRVEKGVLEPYMQTTSKTLMYFLTRVGVTFSTGDIIEIEADGLEQSYVVMEWHARQESGYNRFVLLSIPTEIEWINPDGSTHSSKAYLFDQRNNMLKNELKSRSRSAALYMENLKLAFIIMPAHKELIVDSYMEIDVGGISRSFRVAGFDFLSTPGVMYVSMDPTHKRDMTPLPKRGENDDVSDFFWGGDFGE